MCVASFADEDEDPLHHLDELQRKRWGWKEILYVMCLHRLEDQSSIPQNRHFKMPDMAVFAWDSRIGQVETDQFLPWGPLAS